MDAAGNGGGKRAGDGDKPVVVEGIVSGSVTVPKKRTVRTGAAASPDRPSPNPSRKREGSKDVIVPLRARHDGWTPIRQRTFLRGLSETGSVKDACQRVGLSKTSAYRLRTLSAEFAAAWDKALSIVAPILEQAAYERGVEGWDEPVYQGGKLAGYKRRYSDAALRMLIQRRKTAEEAAAGAGMAMPNLATASIEELEEFARTAAKRAGGMFYKRQEQVACDMKLLQRLDALAAQRRREQGLPPEPPRDPEELRARLEADFDRNLNRET